MSTVQIGFRFPKALIERIDRHTELLREERPGMTVSRADVVRILLIEALDRRENVSSKKRAR